MKCLNSMFFSILSMLMFACKGKSQNQQAPGEFNKIDSICMAEVDQNHIPSIAVGIVQNGKIILRKAYGYRDVENRILADSSTIYQLGSVTKTFTGNVLAHLVSENTIALEDSLSSYFPGLENFPKGLQGEYVSIKDIATHSARFPRYPENLERIDPEPIKGYSKEKLYKGIALVKIDTILGVKYDYSNFGYGVLGTAMENRTHKDLGDLMRAYIFNPLKMDHTSLYMNNTIEDNIATPYLEVNPNLKTEPWKMESLSGAGNLFSNVVDVNKFMLELLKDDAVNNIQQKGYVYFRENWEYGLGCFVIQSEKKDTKVIYHGGDVDGFASSLTLYPEYQLGVVILINYGEGRIVSQIFRKITDAAFDKLVLDKK